MEQETVTIPKALFMLLCNVVERTPEYQAGKLLEQMQTETPEEVKSDDE